MAKTKTKSKVGKPKVVKTKPKPAKPAKAKVSRPKAKPKTNRKKEKKREIFSLGTNHIAAAKIEQFNKIRNVRDAIKKLETVDFLLTKEEYERVIDAINKNDFKTLNSIYAKLFYAAYQTLKEKRN